ncbi:MAG: integrase [Clostridia bacterium]|nr:integrase [Clostridia bacterium]
MLASFVAFIDAKPATIDTYSRNLRQFFAYLAANEITTPTRSDILGYRDYLKASGHKPATITGYIIAVRQFFKWTESEGVYHNAAANIKGARIERSFKKDPLTSRQAQQVLAAIDATTRTGSRDYAILALMMTCGLRTVEVIRADIGDIRALGDETVLYIQGKGKDEKSELVKLAEPTELAIRAYLSFRGKPSTDAPLFASESHRNTSERMTTRSISRIVKERLRSVGLDSDRLSAHSLRHTAATLNLMNGATLGETQQLLRHAKIDTTTIYAHHLDRAKNNSEHRIAGAIFGEPIKKNRRPKR